MTATVFTNKDTDYKRDNSLQTLDKKEKGENKGR